MVVQDRASKIHKEKSSFPDKFLLGNCIERNLIKNQFYCDFNSLIIIGGTKKLEKHNKIPRILIRRIGDSLCCTLLVEKALTESTLYSCTAINDKINIKYVLALLNSKLYTYVVKQNMVTNQQAFPQILMTDLETLKIPIIENDKQLKFAELEDLILKLTKDYYSQKSKIIKLITQKFTNIKITNKLENWSELDFATFLKELEKQKIKLPLSEQYEWLDYFEKEKSKANELQEQIKKTDDEIDRMVYELYDLTYDEIKIIEPDIKITKIGLKSFSN
ncbi:MAG: hypothetical protein A2033_13335 [Bacteroidetes bacterium GWA2_31_9]|nr:MAG: hypothetical protein A2033_13335 [Bacteroidetes bacterium GWA2_31_9]